EVTTDLSSSSDYAFGVALQSDGKIVAAGFSGGNAALTRYNPGGSLDTTFGSGGKVTSAYTNAVCIALQGDGKIVAAGESRNIGTGEDFGVARYLGASPSAPQSVGATLNASTAFSHTRVVPLLAAPIDEAPDSGG